MHGSLSCLPWSRLQDHEAHHTCEQTGRWFSSPAGATRLHSAARFQPAPEAALLGRASFPRTNTASRAAGGLAQQGEHPAQPADPHPVLQAPCEPWCCPHPPPAQALPEQLRRGAAPWPEGQAGVFATLGCARDQELILCANPVLAHLRPFHQPETPQPFGWLSAPQPGPALGAEARPAHPEQQPWGWEGCGAASLTYPAVRPPYVL